MDTIDAFECHMHYVVNKLESDVEEHVLMVEPFND